MRTKYVKKSVRPVRNEQSARSHNKKRHRKRTRRALALTYTFVGLFLVGCGVLFTVHLFLKVSEINVTGSERYSKELIVAATGIELEQSMFDYSPSKIEKKLAETFGYIKSVKISRVWPTAVLIKIEEDEPFAYIAESGKYIVISAGGKILETSIAEKPKEMPQIAGLEITPCEPYTRKRPGGETEICAVSFENDEQRMILDYVQQGLEAGEMDAVTLVDMSDRLNLSLIYKSVTKIVLGSEADIPAKIRMAKKIIELEQSDRIVVDVSNPKKAHVRLLIPDMLPESESEPEMEASDTGTEAA